MAGERELIPDGEREVVLERVCAIDVAKASGKVCVRVPHPDRPGSRISQVWQVEATTNAVVELGDQLACQGVEVVTVESTSDYWRIFFYLLEARGLRVQLVNARDVKNVPGRPKTDRLDAIWLAKLTEKGLLRPSFVPPEPIRVLRDLTRMRVDLTAERTRHYARLEKLLEDALIKVTSVASRIDTVSVREMVEALIGGERDARRLAGLARGRMREKNAALVEALTGRFDEHHARLARLLLAQIDALTAQIAELTGWIEEHLRGLAEGADPAGPGGTAGPGAGQREEPLEEREERLEERREECAHHRGCGCPLPPVARLDEIPGISPHAAQMVIAEIGLDMTRFPTAGHLVSWARLCPRTIQSGPKSRAGRTGKGNRYLKGVLSEVATAAAKTDTFLGERYRRIVKRRGKLRAMVAVARSILVMIWHLLSDPAARYRDLGSDYYVSTIDRDRKARSHIRQLQALGFTVTLATA